MTPHPTGSLRHEISAQPVYPPYLAASVGYPHGRNTFPPAEPGHPEMLPGYPAPQPIAEHPPRSYRRPAAAAAPAPVPPPAPAQPAALPHSYPQPAPHPYPGYPIGEHSLVTHQQAYAAYHLRLQATPDTPDTPDAARPKALILGVTTGALATALTALSQALALFSGRATIESYIAAQLPAGADRSQAWISTTLAAAYEQLQLRAYLSLALCLVLCLTLIACLRAGLPARLGAMVLMAASGLLTLVCVMDLFPSGARLLGLAALALFPVTAALLFLPSVGQYRRRRTARSPIGVPLGVVGNG